MHKRIAVRTGLGLVILSLAFSLPGRAEEDSEFKKGCRECHEEVIGQWDLASVKHPPYVKQKCESCHSAEHKKFNSEKGQPCMVCHNLASEKILKAHGSFNVSEADCSQCHYVHGSDAEGLMKEVVHPPFASGMCEVCHSADADGKSKVIDNIRKACLACHSDKEPKEGAVVHEGFEMLECTECHSPHTTSRERLLRRDVSETCFDCHDKKQAEKHPYDVAASEKIRADDKSLVKLSGGGKVVCTSCHNPHFAEGVFLLKETVEGGKLCYRCHQEMSGIAKEGGVQGV